MDPSTAERAPIEEPQAAWVLRAHLAAGTPGLVSALGPDGRMVPVPESVPLAGQHVFRGPSAMEVVLLEDRPMVVEAFQRAAVEPVVECRARLVADPDRESTIRFYDVRREHGVHVILLEHDHPDLVAAPALADENTLGIAHIERDATATFLFADEAITPILGWQPDQLVGRPTMDLLHPDDAERAVESWLLMRSLGPEDVRMQVRLRHAAGHHVWVEVTNRNLLDDPEVGCVRSTVVDISGAMAQLEALQERERMLRMLAETLPIGICHLRSDGQVVHANPPLVELLGEIETIEDMTSRVVDSDRLVVQLAIERALEGRPIDLEVGVDLGGDERRCELTFRTMRDDDDGIVGVVVCASDVTDRSRLRAELEHRASHDTLSGCLNRAATVAHLERALRDRRPVTVAYLDLDHFKRVNDQLGHAAGDEVLRVAAARLRGVIRADDRLGRIGGDEFVVICPQGTEPIDPDEFVARLKTAICGDVTFARRRIPLQASVGAAVSRDGETDAESLLSRADAAMYADKHHH